MNNSIISKEELKSEVTTSLFLPDYLKQIYLTKIESGNLTPYFLNRLHEVLQRVAKYFDEKSGNCQCRDRR